MRSEKSSRVTKVPLAESRRLFVTESVVVGVHREEGQEEEGEKQEKVKGEVEQLRDNRTCAWREDGMTDSRNLSQMEFDVSVRMTRQPKQRAGVLRPRACWCTSCHCCHCPHWSSRCCTCGQVVLRSHFVRELLCREIFSLQASEG